MSKRILWPGKATTETVRCIKYVSCLAEISSDRFAGEGEPTAYGGDCHSIIYCSDVRRPTGEQWVRMVPW